MMDKPKMIDIIGSSNIKRVGYDGERKKLYIQFLKSNIYMYEYSDVPENVYKELISSESVGSYFHKNIKNVYKCDKIEKEEEETCG